MSANVYEFEALRKFLERTAHTNNESLCGTIIGKPVMTEESFSFRLMHLLVLVAYVVLVYCLMPQVPDYEAGGNGSFIHLMAVAIAFILIPFVAVTLMISCGSKKTPTSIVYGFTPTTLLIGKIQKEGDQTVNLVPFKSLAFSKLSHDGENIELILRDRNDSSVYAIKFQETVKEHLELLELVKNSV